MIAGSLSNCIDGFRPFCSSSRSFSPRRWCGGIGLAFAAIGGGNRAHGEGGHRSRPTSVLQVFVRDNNVEQALRVLKKKMQREGVFREMKRRRFYEKPSERAAREKSEAVRRFRKAARKKAIFDG